MVLKMIRLFLKSFQRVLSMFWDGFVPNCMVGGRRFWGSMKVGFVEVPKMLVGVVSDCCYVVVWLILYVPVFQKCQDDWNRFSAFVYAGLGVFRVQCSNVPEG